MSILTHIISDSVAQVVMEGGWAPKLFWRKRNTSCFFFPPLPSAPPLCLSCVVIWTLLWQAVASSVHSSRRQEVTYKNSLGKHGCKYFICYFCRRGCSRSGLCPCLNPPVSSHRWRLDCVPRKWAFPFPQLHQTQQSLFHSPKTACVRDLLFG